MSFETEVKAGLKSNSDKLDELLIWRAGLDVRCDAHREQTAEVRTVLFEDNPNPGLVKQVNSLLNCKKSASRWRDFWMYVLKVAVAAGVITFASWVLSVYKVIQIGN